MIGWSVWPTSSRSSGVGSAARSAHSRWPRTLTLTALLRLRLLLPLELEVHEPGGFQSFSTSKLSTTRALYDSHRIASVQKGADEVRDATLLRALSRRAISAVSFLQSLDSPRHAHCLTKACLCSFLRVEVCSFSPESER